ncbi:MAG: sigma-70 family RNA polymerase sigma factor [Planctomycetes bacterium]|nr:sigma-70 family RNA polymerase sigma factor [Planctomycetota bacterium]
MLKTKNMGSGQGDPERLGELLGEHRSFLYAFLLSAVRNADDAEDLLQEVNLIAIRKSGQPELIRNFRARLTEVARNLILQHARKSRRGAVAIPPELLQELESTAQETDVAHILDRRRGALRASLDTLRGTSRQVIEMRYLPWIAATASDVIA